LHKTLAVLNISYSFYPLQLLNVGDDVWVSWRAAPPEKAEALFVENSSKLSSIVAARHERTTTFNAFLVRLPIKIVLRSTELYRFNSPGCILSNC
jgi:hypothetical protein